MGGPTSDRRRRLRAGIPLGSLRVYAGGHGVHAARRFAETRFGRIAYVERGTGDAAHLLHGSPSTASSGGALERTGRATDIGSPLLPIRNSSVEPDTHS